MVELQFSNKFEDTPRMPAVAAFGVPVANGATVGHR